MSDRYTADTRDEEWPAVHDGSTPICIAKTAEDAKRIAAALNAQPQAAGEWVMVPREPTRAMLSAGRARAREGYTLEAAWAAMLAAAPERGGE